MTRDFFAPHRARIAETGVYDALGRVFDLPCEAGLDVAHRLFLQLAAYIGDITVTGRPESIRRFALNRLYFMRGEVTRMIRQLEAQLDEPSRLAYHP